ncbi:hydroxylysine kinase [Nilaparvata lugens]|uniref:hydroxylysine kinase n=1 Tax=Nilaparvata lugens TaxID=108931 RepID=UPI00193CF279|nr:hydroxylysine kinase [Nilaparvata lugens]
MEEKFGLIIIFQPIFQVSSSENPLILDLWKHGYVLKIMNSVDSRNIPFVEAQNELMIFLNENNVSTPRPVKNVDGSYHSILEVSLEEGGSVSYVVRLLTYQPGLLLKDVKPSSALFYSIGLFAANLDLKMKEFSHEGFSSRRTSWSLECLPQVKSHLFVLKDEDKLDIVNEIIEQFEENVISRLETLQKGPIHGDLNEQNIIVEKTELDYEMCSIIDFGDSHVSAYVFELSILMCYLLMLTQSADEGRDVVAGYSYLLKLPEDELKLLKVCICGRLVQSLVLGLYFYSKNPTNTYILCTQEEGWKLLKKLWQIDSDTLHTLWCSGIDSIREN